MGFMKLNVENQPDKSRKQSSVNPRQIWKYKKLCREDECYRIIRDYAQLSESTQLSLKEYSADAENCYSNVEKILCSIRKDMIFQLADVFQQNISYDDAEDIISLNTEIPYELQKTETDSKEHGTVYEDTYEIGVFTFQYLVAAERGQLTDSATIVPTYKKRTGSWLFTNI